MLSKSISIGTDKICSILPVKWSKGHFYKKYHFSPVKNIKKCRGRDLNSLLPVKRSRGQFFRKYHFSPVKNVKKVQGTRFEYTFTGKKLLFLLRTIYSKIVPVKIGWLEVFFRFIIFSEDCQNNDAAKN